MKGRRNASTLGWPVLRTMPKNRLASPDSPGSFGTVQYNIKKHLETANHITEENFTTGGLCHRSIIRDEIEAEHTIGMIFIHFGRGNAHTRMRACHLSLRSAQDHNSTTPI